MTLNYTLSLHDALPICVGGACRPGGDGHVLWGHLEYIDHGRDHNTCPSPRSEEHTSELQSRGHLVCRLLLAKKRDACSGCCSHEKTDCAHTSGSPDKPD